MLGGVSAAFHVHGMGVDEAGAPVHDFDARLAQHVFVHAVEPGDFRNLVIAQGGPVKVGGGGVPAKPAGVAKGIGELGSVDIEFFRHTTHVDTGAAHIAVLGHRHPGAKARGDTAGAHATGTGADHKQVVVVGVAVAHGFPRFAG